MRQHQPVCLGRQSKIALARSRAPSLVCRAASRPHAAVPSQPPYNVVITGSTKGIGRALAAEFLKHGDRVVVSSRSERRVAETVQELGKRYGKGLVQGRACNVSTPAEVQALADFAKRRLGSVDIWINNAGTNAYTYQPLTENTDEELEQIVQTNVLGVMLCCREAVRVMRGTERGGHIFNMDGAGADGNATPNFAAYGATKSSLEQLGRSLNAELADAHLRNIAVHNLSPGMVWTDLLLSVCDTPMGKFSINCLAETAEDVARYLVPRVRRVPIYSVSPATGSIRTSYVRQLTKIKAVWKLLKRLLIGSRKNRFVKE